MKTWDDMPDGTENIHEAFAAELARLGVDPDEYELAVDTTPLLHTEPRDECTRCQARSAITDTPCVLPAGHAGQHAMHDNGDYRA